MLLFLLAALVVLVYRAPEVRYVAPNWRIIPPYFSDLLLRPGEVDPETSEIAT